MPERMVLLTGEFEAGGLVEFIRQLNPRCAVEWLQSRDALARAVPAPLDNAVLVSFCSGVIVPAEILQRLGRPSYNVHPGPPGFPGRHPECWAAYYGARRFGATLHEMAPRVDEGAIVDTVMFEVPPDAGQHAIGERAFNAAVELLLRWLPNLVHADDPLPLNGERWHGRKWRRADREALSRVTPDLDAAEFERRRRAFAELPGGELVLRLHGRDFVYKPDREA